MELRLLTYLVALSVGPVLCTALPSVAAAGIPVQRIKVPYGPFFVPGVNEEPSRGMQEFRLQSVQSPCPGASASPAVGCLVLSARAGIQFDSDGTVANANKGMWLHHVVISNNGRKDPVCDKWPERWFASGNERTLVDYTGNGTFKTGYELSATDRLQVTLELMNVSPHPRAVVLTVEYDVVPLPLLPADWNTTRITPIWLDVTGVCGQSEFPVPIGGYQVFNVATPEPAWKSTVAGDVVFAGGHLHDGGTNIKVLQRGKEICNSVATYGGDPAFIDGGTGLEGVVQDHHHDEGEEDGHGHEEDEKDGHGHDEDEKDGHGHGEDEKDGHGHEEGEKDGHSHEESEGHEHAPGTPSTPHSHDDDGHSHGTPSSAAPPPPAATTTAPGRHDHGGHSHRRRHQRRQHGHGSGGESHKPPMAHISDMTVCVAAGKIAKGDELALMAQYDLARHSAMAGHREGELEPIMGIAIVLVAVPVVGA